MLGLTAWGFWHPSLAPGDGSRCASACRLSPMSPLLDGCGLTAPKLNFVFLLARFLTYG